MVETLHASEMRDVWRHGQGAPATAMVGNVSVPVLWGRSVRATASFAGEHGGVQAELGSSVGVAGSGAVPVERVGGS